MMYHAPRPFKLDLERLDPPEQRPDSTPKPGGGSYEVTFGPEEYRLGILLDQGGVDGFEVPHMVMVTEVDEGGNGHKHGLQPGDQIVDINGVNLEELGTSDSPERDGPINVHAVGPWLQVPTADARGGGKS